jgi:hypothetical protein
MPAQNIKSYLAVVASAAALGLGAVAIALCPGAATPAPAPASVAAQTWQTTNTPSSGDMLQADLYSFFADGSVKWIKDPVTAPASQATGTASGGEVVTLAHTQGSNSAFGDGSIRFITD